MGFSATGPVVVRLLGMLIAAMGARMAVAADLVPHEATYIVRFGTAPDGMRIGTARQQLTHDCRTWRIERDVATDIALGPALRLTTESRLKGQEPRGAARFDYKVDRSQGATTERHAGWAVSSRSGARAEITVGGRAPVAIDLPGGVSMPVQAIARVIDALKGGRTVFSFTVFDPELTSGALLVDGGLASADMLRPARIDSPVPDARAWPVTIAFTRAREGGRPLFTLTGLIYENGALDRLSIESGLIAAGADLVAFQPLPVPTCPSS
ncbi:MAG: DUF1849 family protein [Rhodospirillales bacterium]|nr:MAG: DUF1849 family protein [Rhodospirillales bacterium]